VFGTSTDFGFGNIKWPLGNAELQCRRLSESPGAAEGGIGGFWLIIAAVLEAAAGGVARTFKRQSHHPSPLVVRLLFQALPKLCSLRVK
jgi:hypothetical protein